MFHKSLAMRSTTSSWVDSGASAAEALFAADWNPNMVPRVFTTGVRRRRHASMPLSMSEAPVGAGPGLERRSSSPYTASKFGFAGASAYSSVAMTFPF